MSPRDRAIAELDELGEHDCLARLVASLRRALKEKPNGVHEFVVSAHQGHITKIERIKREIA